jgi:hypothetical protein
MSATTLPAPPPAPVRHGGRVAALVAGALIAFGAFLALLLGGVARWADTTQRDAHGGRTAPWPPVDTPTRAQTAEGRRRGDVRGGPEDWVPDLGPVRVTARRADGGPVFVAIAPEARVDAYLRGVAHTEVEDVHPGGFEGTVRAGTREPAASASAGGWAASAAGPGTQSARWDPASGRWALVVMNADGSPGVSVDVQVGARAAWLDEAWIALLIGGLVLAAAAAALIAVGAAPTQVPPAASAPAELAPVPTEPVRVSARLDETLSRGLWLVKWLLLVPHALILAVLWPVAVVLTLVAAVAIVITGRYPRALFDFNVGVLRWSWRVGYYGYSALATDRYPPFTLARTDYPAELDIAYPERLSRWKAVLKPWLLAIPHYLVLAAFFGGWDAGDPGVAFPGLLAVLVAVAAVVLLVRGRYPRDVFSLVVGINRWALRVAAYAGLLRDEYPPFRLDR